MSTSFAALDRARTALVSFSALAGLLLLDGQLGPATFVFRRGCAAALLGLVFLGALRPDGRRGSFLGCWAGVALTVAAPTVPLALAAYLFAVAMLGVHAGPTSRLVAPGVPESCWAAATLGWLPALFPPAGALGDGLTDAARHYFRSVAGAERELSPTALGGPAALALAIFLLWRWRTAGNRFRLLAALLLPAAWFLTLPLALPPTAAGPAAVFARGALLGLCWLALAAAVDAALPAAPGGAGPRHPRRLAALAAASALIGLTLAGVVDLLATPNRNVLVHNRGGLDWERPVWGKFGPFSGGMFGQFPVYAGANGYRVEVLDRDAIEPEDLAGFQTLLLINSPKRWAGRELETVRGFVAAGGSLLVLGDHTDVFGLMEGFNTLLDGFGIRFEFDSAYHARPSWRGCCSTAPDALAGGWDAESPGVAIGASLRLRGAARPLLTGRYAHSDIGERDNVIGSFLGNYRHDEGEKLGDVVLIAAATHGRGRVVVFGDTSPFQGASTYSFPHTVGPLLETLSRPTAPLDRPPFRAGVAALAVLLVAAGWAARAGAAQAAVAAGSLLVGLAAGWAESRLFTRSTVAVAEDCFLIDQSHFPAVGHYEARVNPSGSLNSCLARSGLRVAELERWDPAAIARSRGIGFIAPRRAFSPGEVEDLLRFEEAGGVVLLAVGQPDAGPSRGLIRAHGVDLEARPLGTVPAAGGREKDRPRFLDAWPVVDLAGRDLASVPEVDVVYRFHRDVCALFARRGRGGLLLIADTRFFSSMNLEDVSGYWEGNLALVHDAFRKYLRVDAEAVRPLFRSPPKPD